ncbi:MAG: esterase [Bryobacteraceae bacterium]
MTLRALPIFALLPLGFAYAETKLVSPEVHPDRRTTFRLRAPKAAQVRLWGEWITKHNTTEELKRDDKGIWSVTIGPLEPAIYSYLFLVDDVAVLDPGNPTCHTGREGPWGSLLEVRGDKPQDYETRSVPHGVLHTHAYSSSQGLGTRRAIVYTPPDYDRNRRNRFPVLYLLHGSGDTETSWTAAGRAEAITDNLLAGATARPMIVVMPNGHISPPDGPDPKPSELRRLFGLDLVRDLFPLIDSSYRTLPTRRGRAIAGLSMGAYQAMWFAMDYPDLVSALGVFSGGIFVPATDGEADVIGYATSATARKYPLDIFHIAIGDRDMNLPLSNKLDSLLTRHNIKHEFRVSPGAGHTWPFWRKCLSETLPRLFPNTR